MTTTYEICGCGTITVDVDVLSLNRTARDRLLALVDTLEDMAGIGVAPIKRAPEIVPAVASPPKASPPGPKALTKIVCPDGCGKSYAPSSAYWHRKSCPNRPETEALMCRRCGKPFAKRNGLTIHEKTCRGVPAHEDKEARTARTTQAALDRLAAEREQQIAPPPAPLSIVDRLEDDSPSLECRHCAKTFRTVDGRLRHERGCEGTVVPKRTCQDCGRTFTSNLHHVQHRCPGPKTASVSISTAVLRCDDCSQVFELTGITKLIAHTLVTHHREIHSGERIPQAAAS